MRHTLWRIGSKITRANSFLNLGLAEAWRFVDVGSVRKAGFLSMMGSWGCGMPDAIGVKQLILRTEFVFHSVCNQKKEQTSIFFYANIRNIAQHPKKNSLPQPRGSNLLRKPALYQRMLSRKDGCGKLVWAEEA